MALKLIQTAVEYKIPLSSNQYEKAISYSKDGKNLWTKIYAWVGQGMHEVEFKNDGGEYAIYLLLCSEKATEEMHREILNIVETHISQLQ